MEPGTRTLASRGPPMGESRNGSTRGNGSLYTTASSGRVRELRPEQSGPSGSTGFSIPSLEAPFAVFDKHVKALEKQVVSLRGPAWIEILLGPWNHNRWAAKKTAARKEPFYRASR